MPSKLQIDWKDAAPRWALVTGLVISLGFNGFLGASTIGLVVDRFRLIEKQQRDPLWNLVANLAETQAVHSQRIKQHDESIKDLAVMDKRTLEIQVELKILNDRLKRKGL